MISLATSVTILGLLKAGLRRAFVPLLRSVPLWALPGLFAAVASAAEPGTALVRQAPQVNGRVEGSVHQMLPQGTTLNSGGVITGDLLVPGTPTVRLNGKPSFGGTTDAQGSASPSGYQITLNGNASLGRLLRRVDPAALPSVSAPPAPSGTRKVTLNNAGQSVGAWSTVRDLTLNGNAGSVTVPPGTYGAFTANGSSGFVLGTAGSTQPSVYHFQQLTLNGQSTFKVVGPIIVTVASGISANGTFGAAGNPEWLTLRIANGGLTLNGGVAFYGHVVASSGTVTINGNSRLVGGLVADRLVVNGNGLLSLRPASAGNQAPVAQPQEMSLDEDVPTAITLAGNDPEGAPLSYRIVTLPGHGTAVQQAPGSAGVLYTPAPDYSGPDHFTFVVNDGTVDSPPATVSLTVRPVNDRPVADGKTVELDEDTTVFVTPTGRDAEGATLEFSVAAPPEHGTVTFVDGRFLYQPAPNYHGPDHFTYVADDGDLSSEPAVVEITVRPVNDLPRALAQQVSVSERGTLSVTLAGEDDDGDALLYRVVQAPLRGELTGSAPDLVYTAPTNPADPADSFSFVVNDGHGDSVPAVVSVTFVLVNDPPTAHPRVLRTDEDTPLGFTLTGEDPEGRPLVFAISQEPASGTLSGVAPDLVYHPSADWSGTDEFSFTVNDGELGSAPAKVTITVDPVNDRPVASSQAVSVGWNTSTSISLSAADVDLSAGSALTYGIATLPAKGRLSTAEGLPITAPTSGLSSPALIYTADMQAAGDDSFTFVASDGEAASLPATVSLSLGLPPPPPVITFQAPTNLGEPVNTTSLRLIGALAGAAPFQLTVNGAPVPLAADHSFDRVQSLPLEGANRLVIVATDVLNRKTTLSYTIDRITQAPALEVGHPSADGFITRQPSFQVTGTVGSGATVLLVNGAPVADFSSGVFSHPILLSAGNNLLTVEVRDALGNSRSVRRTLVLDQTPPAFAGLTPVTGFLTRHASMTVSGRVLDGQSLTINGTPVPLAADGAFAHGVVLAEGAAEIRLEATDAAGNILVQTLAGVLDSIAPVLSLDAPVSGATFASSSVAVAGSVDDPGAVLTLNAAPLANTAGTFAASFPLTTAETTLTVTATDAAGNVSTKAVTVRRDTTPPVIAYTAPAPGTATRAAAVRVAGTIDDSSATVVINGRAAAVSSGRFEIPDFALTEGPNTLSAVATDPLGNSSAPVTLTITADRIAPAAPSLIASPAYVKADRLTLQGAAEPGAVVSITGGLATVSVTADGAGSFSGLVLLTPNQASDLLLRATDAVGNESLPSVHRIVSDTLAPVISLSRPADGASFDTSGIEVAGSVADRNLPAALQIAGQSVPLTPAGAFAARITLPDGVAQPLAISVVDLAGNPAQLTRTVTVADAAGDDDAPVIVVLSPAYDAVVPSAEIGVTALVSDESALSSITLGGMAVSPDASGRVAGTVTVDANGEFTLAATDANNLTATLVHRVQVNGLAPAAPTIQRVSPEGVTSATSVLLYASALAGLRYEITGGLLPVQSGTVGADGKLVATVPLTANAANVLQVRVVGASGLASAPATVEVVHDSLAPVVTRTTPAAGATNAPSGAPVQIVFNEPVRAAELAAIEVRAAGAPVACARALSADARTLTLTPAAPFAESANIQITLPATLADLVGNALGSAYSFGFRIADVTAPAAPVLAAVPARVNRLALTLSGTSEPFARVEVAGAAAPVSALADAQGRFALGVTLLAGSVNTLSVVARDAAGNASPPATVTIAHDATALVLQESLPADAATGVALDTALRLTFNKAVDPASLAGVALVSSGNVVAGVAVTVAEGVVSLAPSATLVSGKSYEIVVPATVADFFGNRLGATRRIAFSTGADQAPAAPVIYTALPLGATNLTAATLTGFSTPGTRLVIDGGAASFEFPSDGVIDTTGLFTVTVPLQADAQNSLVLRARDAAGRLSAAVSALSVRQDSIIPTVLGVTPAGGASAVPVQTSVFVEFSEAIQTGPLSATVPAIRLFDPLNAVVPGSWIAAADGRSASFYPARTLAPETRYKLLVSTSVRDLAGNPFAASFASEFTTAAAAQAARPAAPVLDPLASLRTTAASVTLSGSAPAGAQIRVFGGQGGGVTTADAEGRFSVAVALVPASANPLAVVAVVGGALSDPATVTVTQVRHAAALRILSPQAGVEYHNRSVTVAGVIDDPDSVSSITITGSGIAAPGLPATIVGRYFFRQVVLDDAAGTKSLAAVATVGSGSPLEAAVAFSLLVEPAGSDTRAPIPRFIFPEEGDVLNGEVVEALLTVEEGVQLTHVEIADVVAHDVVGNIFLIHARLANQGPNTLTVNATDAAGHVGSSSVNVVMDSIGFASAPTVAARPALTAERTLTLTGTAEPGATIVVLNGLVPVRTVVAADGTYSVIVPLNPNAANQLQVVATDAAGNLSPVTTVHIEHDDTAPTIVSTSPSSGQAGVPVNAAIEVRFSEAIAPASVAPASAVVLRSALGQTIQRNALLSADGKTLRIVPGYKLLRGDTITVELDAAIADVHGFVLGADHVFTFTTAAYQTTVSGIVVDPQLRPLPNVRVGIAGSNLSQTTSSFGTFLLDDAPVGDQLLTIDARPDPQTGLSPQGDARVFGYLEFLVPVRRDVDNSLGRPIFMVETDFSTATPLAASGGEVVLTFTPAQKDLNGFSVTYTAGSGRFADGSARGSLTATRIDAAHIPDRLPSGAIPHFLVELGPDDLVFATPARLAFPNVYNLPAGEEVIVFHFKYGVHDYTELGRVTVGADGRIVTGPILQETGFIGIVPASGAYDLTRGYLQGRVVDAAGHGLAGISVNAIAGTTYAVTDAEGRYSIPLPDVRLELIRAFATVSTDLGARRGESPSLVFQSELVALQPSGVTPVPDIVVDSFFLGGGIRYRDADGDRIPVTGLAYDGSGHLVSIDTPTARAVEILVYRRHGPATGPWTYDSEPYMRTKAGLDPFDDTYDSSFSLSFLGSLAATGSGDPQARIPAPGDVVKLVAFDRATGFYGETDLKIPAAAEADGGDTPLDVLVNLELRPPRLSLDMNRVFFLDGIRRRANIPHRGIAFTGDEYIEFKTTWRTSDAIPLDRPELALAGRLRVSSVGYQTDHAFVVRGGEHARVLELREGIYANRLAVLQRETDVGVEFVSVSPDGSFAPASLVPIEVTTSTYGLAQAPATVVESVSQNVELHILQLSLSADGDGVNVSGRTLPGGLVNVGGATFTADGSGYFGGRLAGTLGTGGLPVQVGSSLATRFGESLAPVLNALDATPPGLVPARGSQGDVIVLNGAHFSPVADDNKVSFNGAVAVVQSASETALTVQVPELASSGDVTVTVAGKRSNAVRFEFLSVGINNGSFEDGTLRAFTLEGSGQVVESWKRVTPTDRQYMAFLDTMGDPRDGLSTLTSDAFEVPEGMQTLLFDYHFVATTLLRPVHEVLELQILTESQTIVVGDLFAGIGLAVSSTISGFDRGSGFRTAGVLVDPWAGTGERIRLRIVLKGRGALPAFIPGMDQFDANPLGLGKNAGTGVFLDHFRLSAGIQPALPPLDRSRLTLVSNGTAAILSAPAGFMPAGSRVFAWNVQTGRVLDADVGAGGGFVLSMPFASRVLSATYLVSYATPAGAGGGRVYGPPIELRVNR